MTLSLWLDSIWSSSSDALSESTLIAFQTIESNEIKHQEERKRMRENLKWILMMTEWVEKEKEEEKNTHFIRVHHDHHLNQDRGVSVSIVLCVGNKNSE